MTIAVNRNTWPGPTAGRDVAGASRPPGRRTISLALQGGGSLGAFTWGVLDRLLEAETVGFDAVSGASAGAINAAVMASGLAKGGPTLAREALERFWRRASGAALSPTLTDAIAFSSRVLSPYQFNPFDLNPLRTMLSHEVDVERIRAAPPFRMLVGTTRVADGGLQVFDETALTIDVLLASACLPLLNQAVTIDGEDYWDGGYAANPPLIPLVEASGVSDILVVSIIPSRGLDHPRSKKDIVRRLDHITFNASLGRDLETIALVRRLTPPGLAPGKLAACRLERIAADDAYPALAGADPLNLDWSFLGELRDAGRVAAEAWLSAGRSDVAQDRPSPDAQSASRPARYVG
jgi:NTE family protein